MLKKKNLNAVALGRTGGVAKAKLYDHAHYVEIGKKGSNKRWKQKGQEKT